VNTKKDIKPILNWATANGEAKIVDRILIKLLPQFMKEGHKFTAEDIVEFDIYKVSNTLYILVKDVAEKFVGSSYNEQEL